MDLIYQVTYAALLLGLLVLVIKNYMDGGDDDGLAH